MKIRTLTMAILLGMSALCSLMTGAKADWAPGDWVQGEVKWWWKYVYPGGQPEGGRGPHWLQIVDVKIGARTPTAAAAVYPVVFTLQNKSTDTYRGGEDLQIKGFCDPSPQPWQPFAINRMITPVLKAGEKFTFQAWAPAPQNDRGNYFLLLSLEQISDIRRFFGYFGFEGSTDPSQTVEIQFLLGDGNVGYTTYARTDNEGGFLLPAAPAGFPMVAVKGDKWLRKIMPVVPDKPLDVVLPAGDANGDNSIDVLDLDILIKHFDTSRGSELYDIGGDLNCDGWIDVFDLDLLIRNFDLMGDA